MLTDETALYTVCYLAAPIEIHQLIGVTMPVQHSDRHQSLKCLHRLTTILYASAVTNANRQYLAMIVVRFVIIHIFDLI